MVCLRAVPPSHILYHPELLRPLLETTASHSGQISHVGQKYLLLANIHLCSLDRSTQVREIHLLPLDIKRQSDGLVEFLHQNRLLDSVVIVEVDPADGVAKRALLG